MAEDEDWQKELSKSITRLDRVEDRFGVDLASQRPVVEKYPMLISNYYFNLIQIVDDPIWRQCIPRLEELHDPYGLEDPLHEEIDSPVPGLTHRYPDRVLMIVSNRCATYCRFCTRKRRVGDPRRNPTQQIILRQIDYIRDHREIRDILISGGDPFLLRDEQLEFILGKLRTIDHVEIIRVGTRVPCTFPTRVTEALCNMLKNYHPLYVNVHFNHPLEITEKSERACGLLADAGIPLGNQSVLLRGVNDDSQVMKDLVQKLLRIRVKPYYLYQMDHVKGTHHFRTTVDKGLEIMRALIGYTSGLAVPHYVIDTPGGGGKIPLLPNYIQSMDENEVILKNYQGRVLSYPQLKEGDELLGQGEIPLLKGNTKAESSKEGLRRGVNLRCL
jgi:lysine 2,3-aminomutase